MNRRRVCGLIGFQSVGKATLYDVLLQGSAKSQVNAPEESQKMDVTLPVFDERLEALSKFCKNSQKHPVELEVHNFTSKNADTEDFCPQFLEDMRKVSLLVHVVRSFGSAPPSPSDEIDRMNSKIIANDIELVRKRLARMSSSRKALEADVSALTKIADWLEGGKSARLLPDEDPLRSSLKVSELQLLSMKPMLYVLNIDESALGGKENPCLTELNASFAEGLVDPGPVLACCVKAEKEMTRFSAEERRSFMKEYGIVSPCQQTLSSAAYGALPLHTFFTTGDTMTHAWAVPRGCNAVDASACIHSSFAKRFRSARVLSWRDYISHASIQAADAAMVSHSKEYTLKDGDVLIVDLSKPPK